MAEDPALAEPGPLAEHLFLLAEGAVAHRGLDGSPARLRRARGMAARLLVSSGGS